jgi:hypothetical protein
VLPPNFLIVGVPRSGTTSLARYLDRHPQIEMSRLKEPAFFHFLGKSPDFAEMAARYGSARLRESRDRWRRAYDIAVRDINDYRSLWSADATVLRRGEATPTYLFDTQARSEIPRHLKDPMILVILRNPIDRAYSQYLQYLRLGIETIYDFERALEQEPVDVDEYWWGSRKYRRLGHYDVYLEPWLREYGEGRVRVLLSEDLANRSDVVLREIFGFLGVDTTVEIDASERFNTSRLPVPSIPVRLVTRSSLAKRYGRHLIPASVRKRVYHRVLGRRSMSPPPFTEGARARLRLEFTSSILRLQELLNRDLSGWLGPGPKEGGHPE